MGGEQIVLAMPSNTPSLALPHHTQQRLLVEKQIGHAQSSPSPKRYYQHIHKSSKKKRNQQSTKINTKNRDRYYASTQNFMQNLYSQAKIHNYISTVTPGYSNHSWIGSSLIPYYLLQTAFTRVVKTSKSSLRYVLGKLIRG